MFGIFSKAKKNKIAKYLDNDPVFLDVRTASEFQKDHIAGSINAPVHKLDNYIDQLDINRPVMTYCAMGGRSAIAARKLKARGFKVVDAQGVGFVRKFMNAMVG
ncbi:MAG: rhodanese-like domain-containing protein [Nonlabens sp.]